MPKYPRLYERRGGDWPEAVAHYANAQGTPLCGKDLSAQRPLASVRPRFLWERSCIPCWHKGG